MKTSIIVATLFSTSVVAAPGSDESASRPLPVWFTVVPAECEPYATIPADAGDVMGWNHLLSLATCLQDASIVRVERPDELPELVDVLSSALAPSLRVDLYALEYGTDAVKIRAAYQIGMAHVALITRARSSLVAPDAVRSSETSAAAYLDLHAQLESLLEPARRTARIAFAAIDHAAAENPDVMNDPVTANMVRSARALLPGFGEGREPSLAHTLHRSAAWIPRSR